MNEQLVCDQVQRTGWEPEQAAPTEAYVQAALPCLQPSPLPSRNRLRFPEATFISSGTAWARTSRGLLAATSAGSTRSGESQVTVPDG